MERVAVMALRQLPVPVVPILSGEGPPWPPHAPVDGVRAGELQILHNQGHLAIVHTCTGPIYSTGPNPGLSNNVCNETQSEMVLHVGGIAVQQKHPILQQKGVEAKETILA